MSRSLECRGGRAATGTRCAEPKRLAEVMALVLPSWCGVDDERAARPCMSFWFRAASEPERPPMAVNLLSMDVIVLACAVFRGVAPLPRARAEGVLCVVCASREPSGATRRVRCARRAAGAARAALGSSRVQRRSGRVRLARCAVAGASGARCKSLPDVVCFCAAPWRRAAELFA